VFLTRVILSTSYSSRGRILSEFSPTSTMAKSLSGNVGGKQIRRELPILIIFLTKRVMVFQMAYRVININIPL